MACWTWPGAVPGGRPRVVDLMADYLATSSGTRCCRRWSPGTSARGSRRHAARGTGAARRDPRGCRRARRAQHDALAAPGVLRLLLDHGIRARDPGRDADGRAGPTRCCGGRRRSATELEEAWSSLAARGARACPTAFDGLLTDTASTSHADRPRGGARGGGPDAAADGPRRPRRRAAVRVYASTEAHSSIEKACMTLGLGRAGVRRIPADDRVRDGLGALAAAIAEDRAAGVRPIAVVATIGTTSSTSVDPVAADRRHRGARGAVAPRRRGVRGRGRAHPGAPRRRSPAGSAPTRSWSTRTSGCSRPLDASLLLTRRMDDAARRVQPGARSTCARSTATTRSATTTSTRRSSAAGSGR